LQLKAFVFDLPDGINTIIGENGVKLSGGEK
jgi:ABC-type multidrug transport system fused ATPase/permease subunit